MDGESVVLTRLGQVFKAEPVLATTLVTAINGILALFVPDEVTVAISAFNVAFAAVVVRALVMPLSTAVASTKAAAEQAATSVVESIDAASAGIVGVSTEAGRVIADVAAGDAVKSALREAGVSRKDITS